jgi:hypothetical protein
MGSPSSLGCPNHKQIPVMVNKILALADEGPHPRLNSLHRVSPGRRPGSGKISTRGTFERAQPDELDEAEAQARGSRPFACAQPAAGFASAPG